MHGMQAGYVVEITTPKKFILRGLWFGSRHPKRVIVWVHGLGGSAFSMRSVIDAILDKETAVLTFNNRGFGVLNKISSAKKKGKSLEAGSAKEVFTDCADDIQGAINFVRKQGVKSIYLAGHSTGCQKVIYWASKKNGGRAVKGIMLFAPISDWAAEMKRKGKEKIARACGAARALVAKGKKHELLPSGLWHEVLDAQRFLSLYTRDSVEEIFSYAQPKKSPHALKSVKVPILTLWAEKDEYADRKPKEIGAWFGKEMVGKNFKFVTIPSVKHGFKGGEKLAANTVRKWMSPRKIRKSC